MGCCMGMSRSNIQRFFACFQISMGSSISMWNSPWVLEISAMQSVPLSWSLILLTRGRDPLRPFHKLILAHNPSRGLQHQGSLPVSVQSAGCSPQSPWAQSLEISVEDSPAWAAEAPLEKLHGKPSLLRCGSLKFSTLISRTLPPPFAKETMNLWCWCKNSQWLQDYLLGRSSSY